MDFRISDTFTGSLARFTNDEQKAVKTAAFDLQINRASPSTHFHKLEKAKDPNFWSVRVSRDIRLIVHRMNESLLLCYVGHHDDAYAWAERRKIERHPTTGAAQLVEIRETLREVVVPKYVNATHMVGAPRPLFADVPESTLLEYGVPREWLTEVRDATEATLFDLADHLPKEAAEALLDLAVGATPQVPAKLPPTADPFDHPDAQRRFRVIESVEELERALEYPWEKWTVFLHPAQRQLVEKNFAGPARVYGSAGTGKTIVALHRAVHLARKNPDARVLLATFSNPLANALRMRVRQLIGNEPRIAERLEVHSMSGIGRRLFEVHFGKVRLATPREIQQALRDAAAPVEGQKFTPYFLWTEWTNVVDAWQLDSWEAYRDVKRLGRRTRLPEKQRQILWSIFERVKGRLAEEGSITESAMFARLASKLATLTRPVFDYAVIDEAQDVGIAELRFLAALGGKRPNALFFAGDLGQRIFQQPFSWSRLGIDVRGRSSRLRINYRTSHQIRQHADRLLAEKLADVDGLTEERKGTISVFNGVPPTVAVAKDERAERQRVLNWIAERQAEGLQPHEIAIFVRSAEQLPRAEAVAQSLAVPSVTLDDQVETRHNHLSIATMHLAKGLEFRAVAVIACDDEVIPLQARIEAVADESELEDVYATERHLLYVACTRARDHLLVTAVEPASDFLVDLHRAVKTT
jgi:superfamily I DNA/RNA helicase